MDGFNIADGPKLWAKPYNENPAISDGFHLFNSYFGLLVDDREGTEIYGFENISLNRPDEAYIPNTGGCFGYVDKGIVIVRCDITGNELQVTAGYWFSTPGGFTITFDKSEKYRLYVCQRTGYRGFLSMGLVEQEGRLKYIDGAFDTLLHPPIKKGYPCLNALYMPNGIHQTMHTHPSTRVGFIFVGGATCQTPQGSYRLNDGDIFYLRTDAWHKFRSDLEDSVLMKLVAYHPDSDFGPTDEEHPMLNRTMVNGVSAKDMPEIQTKQDAAN